MVFQLEWMLGMQVGINFIPSISKTLNFLHRRGLSKIRVSRIKREKSWGRLSIAHSNRKKGKIMGEDLV